MLDYACLLLILMTCQRGKYEKKKKEEIYLFLSMLFGMPLLTDFYQPLKEDELEQSTEVQIIFPAEPKPVMFSYIFEKIDDH